MADEIPLLPEVPERLRLAARQGTLVPFIGAGVSRLGGCPDWNGFADGALRFFVTAGHISHGEYEQLSTLPPRVKLSIAQGLEKQYGVDIDFKALLTPRNKEAKRLGEAIYRHLVKLAPVIVTTNYDDYLDGVVLPPPTPVAATTLGAPTSVPPSRRVLAKISEFDAASLSTPNTVVHIHGSMHARETMVVTTADYLERYAGHRMDGHDYKENAYLSFLQYLFRNKNVLFIGYGLSELEILEYIVEKAARTPATGSPSSVAVEEPRHYMLQGFFSHEANLRRSLTDYYLRQCQIGLLPFSKEAKGHEQLAAVVEHLSQVIPTGHVLELQGRLEMEALLQ